MKHRLFFLISAVLFLSGSAWSEETMIPGTSLGISGTENKIPGTGLALSGYASWEAGQVVKGVDLSGPASHAWVQTGYIGLLIDDSISSRLRVLIQGEGEDQMSYHVYAGFVDTYRSTQMTQHTYYIKRGEGIFTSGNPSTLGLQVELGFFPYKYNADVRNLGEYLFRTYTYPQFINNVFDRPYANLLGLRIGTDAGNIFHGDLLFTSEMQNYPLGDFSLSYVADLKPVRGVDIGAGVDLDRIFPVNSALTTPIHDQPNAYTTPDSGTGNYTFAGIKMMARASFDLKSIVPSGILPDIFGAEDFKIYTEAAILGLKNYPVLDTANAYYTKLSQRIPIMGGFDIPAFKMLDVLALELEYFNNPYPNSFYGPFEQCAAVPYDFNAQTHAKWKWSVYAKRSIGKHFFAVVQVGRDHEIPLSNASAQTVQNYTDLLLNPGDWWWTAKTEFDF